MSFIPSAARRTSSLLFGLTLVTAPGCSSSAPTAPVGETFTLGIGGRVSIVGTPLVLTFQRLVEDSRCPPDVTCVWSGNARIELDVRIGTEHTAVLLNTHVDAREAIVDVFRITLVELTPPPPSNVTVGDDYYKATLRVVRTDGTACTEEARPALSVTVVDSLQGAAVFTDLVVKARDGEYVDSVFHETYPTAANSWPVALAYERAGTYQVTVTADGYVPWVRPAVVVERDACHVVTVPLTARLAR